MGGELAASVDWGWIQLGPLGTWVSAAATVAAFVWAIRQTLKESRESNADRRTAHAQQISVWLGFRWDDANEPIGNPDAAYLGNGLYLGNSSTEPVYNVVAYLVWVQGASYRTGEKAEEFGAWMAMLEESGPFSMHRIRAAIQVLPPGRFVVNVDGPPSAPPQGQLGVEIAFTDRAGRHWVRRADGKLEDLRKPPIDHYEINRPLQYRSLKPGP